VTGRRLATRAAAARWCPPGRASRKRFRTAILRGEACRLREMAGDGARLASCSDAFGRASLMKTRRGINHGFAMRVRPLPRQLFCAAQQAGLHRVDFHNHVLRSAPISFLLVGQLSRGISGRLRRPLAENIFLGVWRRRGIRPAEAPPSGASSKDGPGQDFIRPAFMAAENERQFGRPLRASSAFE